MFEPKQVDARPVTDFMSSAPLVRTEDPVEKALRALGDAPEHVVVVVDASDAIKGIITASDVAKMDRADKPRTAIDLASTDVIALLRGAKVGHLRALMQGNNPSSQRVRTVPIVDAEKRAIGIVTREGLIKKLRSLG